MTVCRYLKGAGAWIFAGRGVSHPAPKSESIRWMRKGFDHLPVLGRAASTTVLHSAWIYSEVNR